MTTYTQSFLVLGTGHKSLKREPTGSRTASSQLITDSFDLSNAKNEFPISQSTSLHILLIWLYLTLSLFSFTLADVLVYGVICLDRTQNKVLHCTCDDNKPLVNEIPKCFFFYEWLLQYWVLLRRTIKWQLYNNHISFYNSYFIPVICWLYLCYHFPMNVSCISQSTNIHSIAVNWYGICLQQLHRFNRFSQYCTDFWCLRKSVRMLNKTV